MIQIWSKLLYFFCLYDKMHIENLLGGTELERELESKIFNIEDYDNKESMEIHIKEYIK